MKMSREMSLNGQKRQLGQFGPKINETLFYDICLLVSYECGFKSVGECHGFPSKTPCVWFTIVLDLCVSVRATWSSIGGIFPPRPSFVCIVTLTTQNHRDMWYLVQGCPNSRSGRHTYQWQCPCPSVLPLPLVKWWSGYKLRQAQTSISLGWTFVQPRPSPRGNEAAAAASFPLDLYGLRAL